MIFRKNLDFLAFELKNLDLCLFDTSGDFGTRATRAEPELRNEGRLCLKQVLQNEFKTF